MLNSMETQLPVSQVARTAHAPVKPTSACPPRAYAKLQGMNGLVFYMKGFAMSFGRGPGVDWIVSNDPAISRVHARIDYSVEEQAFELAVLGKNGAFVNGVFIRRNEPPRALASQTEITIGKINPVSLMFLLPCAQDGRPPSKVSARPNRSLLSKIGQVISKSNTGKLSAREIVAQLRKDYGSLAESIGSDYVLSSAVRHELTTNQHLFYTHSADELEANIHAPDVELFERKDTNVGMPASLKPAPRAVDEAKFSIAEGQLIRFLADEGSFACETAQHGSKE